MSSNDRTNAVEANSPNGEDPFDTKDFVSREVPAGVDRRDFLIRSAVGGAAAVMMGSIVTAEARTTKALATLPVQQPGSTPPLSKDLNVVKKGAGPVLTTVDEFYKVGPGPSSSHTIGPMRITYDFYQRADEIARRQTGQGDGFEGPSFRKPQRYR